MLNDHPRPEDLPEPPPSPYAALPPELATRATTVGAPSSGPAPAGHSLTGGPAGKPRPDERLEPLGPGRRWVTVTVAVVAVLALVAVTALAVWGAFRSGDPLASDQWDRTPATTLATPAPGDATTPGSPATGSPATPTPSASARTDYPAALAAFYTQRIDWRPCSDDGRHRCGAMEVPVDYADPRGERFTLALRKVPATDPSRRLGSLVVNPGGPGGSGVQYAQLSSFAFTPELRAAYDIVGFDPRGIGESSPVRCLRDADMDRLFSVDPTPDTAAERSELLAAADGITASCAKRGGDKVRHLSSTEVARDMDVMRVLLGDRKLNFFGGSYGTFLGAIYADMFPKHVGRMVLDSAMSPNQTEQQEMTYDIQGFESSIDAFIDWCVARPDCALGSDKGEARGRIVALLDAVERNGLRTSKPGLQSIGEGWVGFAIFMCLYSSQSWPTLNAGLAQAFKGQGDILLAKGMSVVERSASGTYADSTYLQAMIPVRCADWPRVRGTAGLEAAQARAKAAHPLWARMTGELYDNCRTWPTPGRTPKGTTLGQGAGPDLSSSATSVTRRRRSAARGSSPRTSRPASCSRRTTTGTAPTSAAASASTPPWTTTCSRGHRRPTAPPAESAPPGPARSRRDFSPGWALRILNDRARQRLWRFVPSRFSSVGQSDSLVMNRSSVRFRQAAPDNATGQAPSRRSRGPLPCPGASDASKGAPDLASRRAAGAVFVVRLARVRRTPGQVSGRWALTAQSPESAAGLAFTSAVARERRGTMANHVYSISEVVGSSPDGVEAAVDNAIAKAATTLRNLDWFEVQNIRGQLDEQSVAHWQVTVKIGFRLED